MIFSKNLGSICFELLVNLWGIPILSDKDGEYISAVGGPQ